MYLLDLYCLISRCLYTPSTVCIMEVIIRMYRGLYTSLFSHIPTTLMQEPGHPEHLYSCTVNPTEPEIKLKG